MASSNRKIGAQKLGGDPSPTSADAASGALGRPGGTRQYGSPAPAPACYAKDWLRHRGVRQLRTLDRHNVDQLPRP